MVFVKYDEFKLNVLDVEKKIATIKNADSVRYDSQYIVWMDVCPNEGNLIAFGGTDRAAKIFDRRKSQVVKTFRGLHSGKYSQLL